MVRRIYKNNSDKEFEIKKALAKRQNGHRGMSTQDIAGIGNQKNKVIRTRNIRSNQPNKNIRQVPGIANGKKASYKKPTYSVLSVPDWFDHKNSPVDVSIIVPMYKSHEVIKKQIQSWDLVNDGLVKEAIYVDDHCPNKSHNAVLEAWGDRKNELKSPVGRIIYNHHNGGFGDACNNGADNSTGKYLLFLNADCWVTKDWVRPMYELMESDSSIGMVGNMQLNRNGQIDSAGSAWNWNKKYFEHIGRNTYNGTPLTSSINLDQAPKDLLMVAERQMVTGCCFMIRRDLFLDLGGFDTELFRVGYWEDSDLCMRVKWNGYKIYYHPGSIIYHSLGHTKSMQHPYKNNNIFNFYKRWVNNGRIDFLLKENNIRPTVKSNVDGKVVGCVIACNEEEFLEAAVESASPIVDEWVFVIGGNEHAYKAGMCEQNGMPTDNTLEIAHKLANTYGGKVIPPPDRLWKDKVEMRNAYVKYLNVGDWMFMLDGDEIYKEDQLWKISELMKEHDVLIMQFWLFWNNINTIGTGSWENFPQERVVKWHPGFEYKNGNHLHVSTQDGKLAKNIYPTWKGDHKLFYHYSWIRPIEKIRQKLLYYKYQSGNNNDQYVDNVFLKWRIDPESVRGNTHPMRGGDFDRFPGIHPEVVQRMIHENKLSF